MLHWSSTLSADISTSYLINTYSHTHAHTKTCASYGTSRGVGRCICFLSVFETGKLQMWISPESPHIWTGLKSRPKYLVNKVVQNLLSLWSCRWTIKAKKSGCFGGMDVSQVSPYTKHTDGYLVKNTTKPHSPILDSAFFSDSKSVWGSPHDFLSLLLLFHFLPANGKTEITLLKSMALQGQSFCVGTSGKQEQQWLNGTLRDLEFHSLMGLGP